MDAKDMATMRLMAIAIAHAWATSTSESRFIKPYGGDAFFYVRMRDIGWGSGLLEGKRIKVTVSVEDDD